MPADLLPNSIDTVPPGRWGVGVSGGADSVALLLLLRARADLLLHVVHLDHQTRAGESAKDAAFVADLAQRLNLPCTIAIRSEIEAGMSERLNNPSSRFRKARFELFRRVVIDQKLQGVLLAHHADDQAETVLLRILRGAACAGLAGIQPVSVVGGLQIVRPLLAIPCEQLREFLRQAGQDWREDSSNQSDQYRRNRARQYLKTRPLLRDALLQIGAASCQLRSWLDRNAPELPEQFDVVALADLPLPLARHSALKWLVARGVPAREVNARTAERLVEMANDAASPARQDFPGPLRIVRRRGVIQQLTELD